MAVTSKPKAASHCRKNILSLLLVLSVFAGAFSGMAALAQSAVVNTATIAPPAGTADPDPDNDSDDAVLSVTPLAVEYDFCPAGQDAIFSIVNGVEIWRYDAGAGADAAVPELEATVSGDLNGLMVDPVRNRLLFISRSGGNTILWAYDAANGGWYQATAPFASPDFPRAGMTPGGVGYLIAGNNATPEVWEVTADPTPGSFGYSVANIGNLSYDQGPSNTSSGDIAFDADGVAWLSAGVDLYKVDLAGGSLLAQRQVRPLLNGAPSGINWAGVAFAADGTLYVADNTASSAYYAYDPATGVLTQAVGTGAGGSRDLASCAFPALVDPELSVVKTLAEVNGASHVPGTPVQAGDSLAYAITVTNSGGTVGTLFEGDVVETLPAGTTFIAAGSDFTCSGSNCPNADAFNITAGASVTLDFLVQVDDPTPPGVESIDNAVSVAGVDCAAPGNDCDETTPLAPAVAVVKNSDPVSGASVAAGETIIYTLTATIGGGATTDVLTLTDTLDPGLTFGEVTDAGGYACIGALECSLPAGTVPGTYAVTYTATVDANAVGSLGNSVVITSDGGDPDPECTTCSTTHGLELPVISTLKSADPADGSQVQAGQVLTYTLTTTVATSATTAPYVLTDTLGDGLTFGAVTSAGAFACTGELVCTLPAATPPGTYVVTYTASVDADATGAVGNSVAITGDGGDPDPECTSCSTSHEIELPTIVTVKTADPGDGGEVQPGDTITYTLTTTIASSATTAEFRLTDTLGSGLVFGDVTDAGDFACTEALECTLPAGTLPGTYAVTYTATVDAGAIGTVGNSVAITGDGGDPEPECSSCSTEHGIEPPTISTVKTADPADGEEVNAGDVLTYTLTTTVAISATTAPYVLTDTFGDGLTLLPDSVVAAEGGSCEPTGDGLVCTLAAGALPGGHVFTYQARVDADAVGAVGNSVTGAGGGDPDPECGACSTEHPLAEPVVTVAKTSDPGDGAEVSVGDTIVYTLSVTIANAAITTPVLLTDTPGAGLAVGELPAGCTGGSGGIACTVAAGAVPGVYTFSYPATVDASAAGEVTNAVISEYAGTVEPVCQPCGTSHRVLDDTELRIVKAAGVRSARIGDLVRYTLTVENVGVVNLVGGTVVDTPPQGFSYVEGSMTVEDGDDAFELAAGRHPLGIGGLDIAVGERATIVYLLRVGAGVRHGTQVNEAVARNGAGAPISNVATAQVTIEGDPLLDDSLIFGTVFDDRDGDGWQDSAALSGVRVQGGFAPGAYVAGSTTLERGAGAEPVADASAPLLHGIVVGEMAARQSEADPGPQVVIRQRLREAAFTDDFVLTSDQGVTVRMDAAGRTTVARTGDAARGLTAAEPTVERRIAHGEGGVVVDYVIGNAGIDERGIPGVRIASVEGLLVETDQYGRYHLVDVQGGERGYRNFILKVDPSTLPPGTPFTTDNPLLRRITPGVPVRFDFGVQLPVEAIPGGSDTAELTLGEVIFAPGSAEVRSDYLPAIAEMAAQVNAHGGGEVAITADGDSQPLAFDRAGAVRDLLLAQIAPEHRGALTVEVRTEVHDALVAGVNQSGALLGTVLFDTDRAAIRPEFRPLLDRVAARLEQLGGGVVALVGHTDVRGSHAYNTELGLRRARAVYEALAERLSPELRARVRVESSNDPTAPVGPERK